MKEEYSAPSFEITEFCTADIITISTEPTTTTSRDPLNFPTSIFKYGLSDCIILFRSVMTRKAGLF